MRFTLAVYLMHMTSNLQRTCCILGGKSAIQIGAISTLSSLLVMMFTPDNRGTYELPGKEMIESGSF